MDFKIFIAQPMNGRTEEEIFRTMYDTFYKVKTTFDLVATPRLIDQTQVNAKEKNNSRLYFLGRSIQYLEQADLVIFTDRWDKANGCRVEYEVCCRYGIPIMIDGVIGIYDMNTDIHREYSIDEFIEKLPSINEKRKKEGTK